MSIIHGTVFADLQRDLEAVDAGELLTTGRGGEALVSVVDRLRFTMADLLNGLAQVLDGVPIDEKEGYVRMHVARCAGFDIRLHIWLPVRGEAYVENVHDHRRYMVSRLVCGSYRSYEFSPDPIASDAVRLDRVDLVAEGDTRLIGPATIHAIGNPFAQHCVSLIVRGQAVTTVLRTFDRVNGTMGRYEGQKPVQWTGRSPADKQLSMDEYGAVLISRVWAETTRS